MEDSLEIELKHYRSMSADEQLESEVRAEIKCNGYALLSISLPNSENVIAVALGLERLGHPEIMCSGSDEPKVSAFVKYLAQRVVEHQDVFSAGQNQTPILKNLEFAELPEDPSFPELISFLFGHESERWLRCQLPVDAQTTLLSSSAPKQWKAA